MGETLPRIDPPRRKMKEIPPIPEQGAGATAGVGWLVAMDAAARGGDDRAANALRGSARARPDLWQDLTAISTEARNRWLDLLAPDTTEGAMGRIVAERDAATMYRELLVDGPGDRMERLMVERVVVATLAATYGDRMLTHHLGAGGPITLMAHYQRQAERLHREQERALEALARVRRLRGPAVQVNATVNVNATPAGIDAAAAAVAIAPDDAAAEVMDGAAIDAIWRDQAVLDPAAVAHAGRGEG